MPPKSLSTDPLSCLIANYETDNKKDAFAFADLVAVAQFDEPIYPYLKPLDSI